MNTTENPLQVQQQPTLLIQATLADLENILRKVMREIQDPAKTRLDDVASTLAELGKKIGVSDTTAYRLNAQGFLTSAKMTTDGGKTVYLVEKGKEAYKRYKEYIKAQK